MIKHILVFVLLLLSMNSPVSAQTGWIDGQTYEYQTTWYLSEESFDQNGIKISSEHLNEEQEFVVKIHDMHEINKTIELFSLFDNEVGNNFDLYRDSVFDSRSEFKSTLNYYLEPEYYFTPNFTYLHSYNYNQSYFWFIPIIYYHGVDYEEFPFRSNYDDSKDLIFDIVFNSFDLEPKNYITSFYSYDYIRYITSYLFIEPNFKLINDNIGAIIKDLGVYKGKSMTNSQYTQADGLTLEDLVEKITSISFMGESSLDDGISKLRSTTQEWSLSMDMTNIEFLNPRFNYSTRVLTWEKRIYDKYTSSIELSYTEEGLLESLITKIEKISTGDNNTINTLFGKSIFLKGIIENFEEFYTENKLYIPFLNGLLIALIVILLVKNKIKKEGSE